MRHFLVLGAFLAFAPGTASLAQQASGSPPAQQTGNAQAVAQEAASEVPPVQRIFNQCQACHTFEKGAKTLIGPNLHGIFGRRAASIEGYRYSVNMKQLGETGQVWSEETLRPYLTNPRAIVPKTAMRFPGISNEQHLTEFLPLLKEATGAP